MIISAEHPTALVIAGVHEAGVDALEKELKQRWCSTKAPACGCSSCRMVSNHAHYRLMWISPESGYKIEDIEPLLQMTKLARGKDDEMVCVLDRAEWLSTAVANRLLALLEEPPVGYHFILLTTNGDAVLPTIVSRCMVHRLAHAEGYETLPPLCQAFSGMMLPDPITFEQIIKGAELDHRISQTYFHQLLAVHIKELHEHFEHEKLRTKKTKIIDTLQAYAHKLPAQGSSELFWKSLYLAWPS